MRSSEPEFQLAHGASPTAGENATAAIHQGGQNYWEDFSVWWHQGLLLGQDDLACLWRGWNPSIRVKTKHRLKIQTNPKEFFQFSSPPRENTEE